MLKKFILGGVSSYTFLESTDRKVNGSDDSYNTIRNAICILNPDNNSGVNGLVSFRQETISSPTKIIAKVMGLKPNSRHGFHIHEYGDLSEGCKTAGPHYNPYNKSHGGPMDSNRHIGDLGNLRSDEKGVAFLKFNDPYVKLFGDASVIGRSCVVHANEDDLGRGNHPESKTTGNSGPRVACGVIALSEKYKEILPE